MEGDGSSHVQDKATSKNIEPIKMVERESVAHQVRQYLVKNDAKFIF
jgi:phage anti-repressor protein